MGATQGGLDFDLFRLYPVAGSWRTAARRPLRQAPVRGAIAREMSRMIVVLAFTMVACRPPPAEEPPVEPVVEEVEPARADPVIQESFTFEVGVAWNRHHKFGADGERLYSTVKMMLYGGGKARIEDGGKRKLSTLDNTYGYEAEVTEWSNVWVGTWVEKEDALTLDLALFGRGCTKVVEGLEGTPSETGECDEVPEKVTLECKADGITLDPVLVGLDSGGQGGAVDGSEQIVDAWVCHPTGEDVDLGGTPVSWVFGKDACLEASSGPHSSRSYGPCREDEPI